MTELSKSFVLRAAPKDGATGKTGASAWSVHLLPEVLSFKANSNGQLVDSSDKVITGKDTVVSVYYGNEKADSVSLSAASSLVGCTADVSGSTITLHPILTAVTIDGKATGKYTPATGGSATFTATATKTIDGTKVTATLDFSVTFTCDVHTQYGELIVNDEKFSSKLTEVDSNVGTLTKSVSTIEQTAKEIKLSVEQSTNRNNLIPNSWLNMVSNDYGGTCVRTVQLTAGTTYVLSVEGRTINAARLRCYIYDADWTEQAYAQITSTSMTTATTTFTPKTTGTYYIGFYNRTGSDSQYYHVRRVKLEVAQMQDNDGNYIATGWCESEQDTDNSDLIKTILFGGTENVTAADGTTRTAYVVNLDDKKKSEEDGGIAVYPASTSELTALAAGETYTLSFFAKGNQALTFKSFLYTATGEDTQTMCQGSISSDQSATPSEFGDGYWKTSLGTEWQRVSVTFTTRTTLPAAYKLLVCRLETYGQKVWITDVKLEKGGRYTANAVTVEKLLATGVDIRTGLIKFTADNFVVQNNAGQTTASIDKDGNLTVPALRTLNKANSEGYAVGNVVIRNNLIELFGASFKVMEIGVEQDNGFIHFFNQSGRLVWGVEDGGAIDYKTGVVVNLTNLQYLPDCFSDNSSRLSTLISTAKAGGTATLTDEEQAAMIEMTKSGATEVLARYYAPHESATSDTTLPDDAHDLTTAAQTAAYDQRVFVDGLLKDGQLVAAYYDLTSNSDLWERLRFDVSPLTSTDTDSVTYRWDIHEIIVSGDSKNMVSNNYTFYYKAAIS